jgi:hypothetical protein
VSAADPSPQVESAASGSVTNPSVHVHGQADASSTEIIFHSFKNVFVNISIGTARPPAPLTPPPIQAPHLNGSPTTPASPVPFVHMSSPGTPCSGTKKKFKSVTVGKCCGLFDNW